MSVRPRSSIPVVGVILTLGLLVLVRPAPSAARDDEDFVPARAERFVEIWLDDPADEYLFGKVYETYAKFDRVAELVELLKRRAEAMGEPDDVDDLTPRQRRDHANVHLSLARIYDKEGSKDELRARVEIAVRYDSESPLALSLLAGVRAQRGDVATACELLEKAGKAERRPDRRVEIWKRLGALRLRAKEREKAVEAFERILAENPDDYFQQLELAEIYASHELYVEAIDVHQRIIDGPGKTDTALQLKSTFATGQLLEKMDDTKRALRSFEEIVARTGEGHWLREQAIRSIFDLHVSRGWFADLRSYLEERFAAGGFGPRLSGEPPKEGVLEPAQIEVLVLLARALTLDGRYREADERLAEAIEGAPRQVALRRALVDLRKKRPSLDETPLRDALRGLLEVAPGDDRARIDLAVSFYRDRRNADAREAWSSFAAPASARPQALIELARRLDSTFRRKEGLRLYQAAAAVAPKDDYSYARALGQALFKLRRRDEALTAWAAMAPEGTTDPRAFAEQGRVLREAGLASESAVAFTKAVELAPDDYRMRFALGEAHRAAEDLEEATLAFHKAVELARDDEERRNAHHELITLYHVQGKLKELIEKFETRIVESDDAKTDASLHAALGDMYREDRENDLAIKYYERAHALDEKNALIARSLAELYALESEITDALRIYQHLADTDPIKRHLYMTLQGDVIDRDPSEEEETRREAAREMWRRVLEEEPTDSTVLADLALRFGRPGDEEGNKDAARALELACRVDADKSELWRSLGMARAKLDDDLGAFEAYLEAAKVARAEDEVVLARGLLYESALEIGATLRGEDKHAEALDIFRKAFVRASDAETAGSLAAQIFICQEALEDWDAGADLLHRLVLDYPTATIRIDESRQANAAWFARLKLRELPESARARFLKRHEEPARQLYARFEKEGDPSLLEGVLVYQLSSIARRAAVRLGEARASERSFDEASRLFERALVDLKGGGVGVDGSSAGAAEGPTDAEILAHLCAVALRADQTERAIFYLSRLARQIEGAPVAVRLPRDPDAAAAPTRTVAEFRAEVEAAIAATGIDAGDLAALSGDDPGRARWSEAGFEPPLTVLWTREVSELAPGLGLVGSQLGVMARAGEGIHILDRETGELRDPIAAESKSVRNPGDLVAWPGAGLIVEGGELLTAYDAKTGKLRFKFDGTTTTTDEEPLDGADAMPGVVGTPGAAGGARSAPRSAQDAQLRQMLQRIQQLQATDPSNRQIAQLIQRVQVLMAQQGAAGATGAQVVFRSPLPVGARLYVPTDAGEVWAFDADGRPLWRSEPGEGYAATSGAPRLLYSVEADVLILVRGNRVHVLDPRDGEESWGGGAREGDAEPRPVYVAAAASGGRIYLATAIVEDTARLVAFDLASSEKVAETDLAFAAVDLAVTPDLAVVFSPDEAVLVGRDAKTLERRWETSLEGPDMEAGVAGKLVVAGSTVYLATAWLRAHDLETGRLVWQDKDRRRRVRQKVEEGSDSGIAGITVTTSSSGAIVLHDQSTSPYALTRPIFFGGRLLTASADGTVIAFNRFGVELELATKKVAADPDDVAAHLRLARLYRQADRSAEEIAALTACIEAAARRGGAGDERRAEAAREAIVHARVLLAVGHLAKDEPAAARTELEHALREGGAVSDRREPLVRTLIGITFEREKRLVEAVKTWAEVLGMGPADEPFVLAETSGAAEHVRLGDRAVSIAELARERAAALVAAHGDGELASLVATWGGDRAAREAAGDARVLIARGLALGRRGGASLWAAGAIHRAAGDRHAERWAIGLSFVAARGAADGPMGSLEAQALARLAELDAEDGDLPRAHRRFQELVHRAPDAIAASARERLAAVVAATAIAAPPPGDLGLAFKVRVTSTSVDRLAYPSPARRGGTLFLATEDGASHLVALELDERGKPRFEVDEPALDGILDAGPLEPGVVLAGPAVVVAASGVAGRDAETGDELWRLGRQRGVDPLAGALDLGPALGLAAAKTGRKTETSRAPGPESSGGGVVVRPKTTLGPGRVVAGSRTVIMTGGRRLVVGGGVGASGVPITLQADQSFSVAADPDAPDRVYVLDVAGRLHAIRSSDGAVLWRLRVAASPYTGVGLAPTSHLVRGGYGPGAPALRADEGRVVVADGKSITVVDGGSGAIVRRLEIDGVNAGLEDGRRAYGEVALSDVRLVGPLVYAADLTRSFAAYDIESGAVRWVSPAITTATGEGLLDVVETESGGRVIALLGKSHGELDDALQAVWSWSWEARKRSWPGKKLWYHDPSDGAPKGDHDDEEEGEEGRVTAIPALVSKTSGKSGIRFARGDKSVGTLHPSMTIVGDRIYIVQETVLVVDVGTGAVLGQMPIGGGPREAVKGQASPYRLGFLPPRPIAAGGVLYVVRPDGHLHAYRERE